MGRSGAEDWAVEVRQHTTCRKEPRVLLLSEAARFDAGIITASIPICAAEAESFTNRSIILGSLHQPLHGLNDFGKGRAKRCFTFLRPEVSWL